LTELIEIAEIIKLTLKERGWVVFENERRKKTGKMHFSIKI
jgi:hypothetical protein